MTSHLFRNRQKVLDSFFQIIRVQFVDSSEKSLVSKVNLIQSSLNPVNHGWFAKIILREILSNHMQLWSPLGNNEKENAQPAFIYDDKMMKLNKRLVIPGGSPVNISTERTLLEFVSLIKTEDLRTILKASCTSLLENSVKELGRITFNLNSFKGILALTRLLGKLELGSLDSLRSDDDDLW